MEERVWRHLFVQKLVSIIREKAALGQDSAFKLAFECVDAYWRDRPHFMTPEDAASAAFEALKRS